MKVLIRWKIILPAEVRIGGYILYSAVSMPKAYSYQTSLKGSNFHRKKIAKLTFPSLALRRHFPIRLRR